MLPFCKFMDFKSAVSDSETIVSDLETTQFKYGIVSELEADVYDKSIAGSHGLPP